MKEQVVEDRKALMKSAKVNDEWIVVTESDGSKVAFLPVESVNGHVWIMWHEWHESGHTVRESIVARSIVKRHPDVELANEAPEQCHPTEDVIN